MLCLCSLCAHVPPEGCPISGHPSYTGLRTKFIYSRQGRISKSEHFRALARNTSTALNQGTGFRPCVAFRSKGVSVSFTPFCASEYRNGTRDTNHTYPEPQLFSTACFGHDFRNHALCVPIFCIGRCRVSRHPFHAFIFPRSCKYSGILPLIRRAAAAFSATPARLGIKKESNKVLLPSCKTGTLAGVARSCVSFDPMGCVVATKFTTSKCVLIQISVILTGHPSV